MSAAATSTTSALGAPAWAIGLMLVSLAITGLLSVLLYMARRGDDRQNSQAAQQLVMDESVQRQREATDKVRHELVVSKIDGVGVKLDATNSRVAQIENSVRELANKHNDHALEIERLKARRTPGTGGAA